jgi:nucleoside-diphosphate-sugar epimerase
LLDHKPAIIPGDLDLPHSYAYVKDMAKNASILADNPESFGKVWHLPCSNAITQRQIFDILRDMLSRNPEIKTYTGKSGLFGMVNDVPMAMRDFMYQYNRPFVSNHTRFATTFGERCTPHPQALWETLEWYRRNGLGA